MPLVVTFKTPLKVIVYTPAAVALAAVNTLLTLMLTASNAKFDVAAPAVAELNDIPLKLPAAVPVPKMFKRAVALVTDVGPLVIIKEVSIKYVPIDNVMVSLAAGNKLARVASVFVPSATPVPDE